MTIENVTPLPRSTIGAGDAISFTVADTYTQMDIQAEGVSVYTTAGGPQTGYTVKVVVSGGYHIFTIKKTAGWTTHPVVVQVTEDQDTDVRLTVFSYDLPGVVRFPPQVNPAPSDFIKLRVSEDDGTPIEDVSWIDVVSGTPPDGMTATSAGPPDAQLEATAATTDPDALHDNVANEISALTDKGIDPTVVNDWVLIEDEDAGFAKKTCTVENLVGRTLPEDLEDDLGCKLLYVFNDNNRLNTAAYYNFDVEDLNANSLNTTRRVPYVAGGEGKEGRWFPATTGLETIQCAATITPYDSTFGSGGECTVQWVGRIGGDRQAWRNGAGIDYGLCLFGLHNQNRDNERSTGIGMRATWNLWLENNGVDATHYFPSFNWRDSTNTVTTTVVDWNTVLTDYGMYHIVGRRQSDGLGTYTGTLFVNGLKVAEELTQPAAFADTGGGNHKVFCGTETGHGIARCTVFNAKYSNTALTDAQINSEYKKALGYA